MIHYYEMVIHKYEHIDAIHNLIFYYQNIEKNNEKTNKYFEMLMKLTLMDE
jgi:hypothetical protein